MTDEQAAADHQTGAEFSDTPCDFQAPVMVRRVASATKMQAAVRASAARRMLNRARGATLCVQRFMRGCKARRRVRRWRRAVATVRAIRLISPRPYLISPRTHLTPQRQRSGLTTFRLTENIERLRRQELSPTYYDLVVESRSGVTLQDALYESAKRHFRVGQLERALVDFQLVRTQLERVESRKAARQGRASRFNPAHTEFRNLDDYIDKCSVGIARREQRAAATVLDQRAILADGGIDLSEPSVRACT